jgi:hypothetical protein
MSLLMVGWLIDWSVYFCCFHLEHRASVERFVSLQFLNVNYSVGLLGRAISSLQDFYLIQTQNKHRHPRLETIPALERAKTVHSLDRTATAIEANIYNQF